MPPPKKPNNLIKRIKNTIKVVQSVITENAQNLVYQDFVARKVSYNEDTLITQVHKFCVHDALVKLGFLFGIDPSEEPQLDFDYDLFCNAIHSKLAKTFNDRDLRLLADLARIVEYLAGHKTEDGKTADDFYFGVNKFAPVWEAMVDKIFGTVSIDEKRTNYNPSLKHVAENNQTSEGDDYQEEVGRNAEYKRSTLRPDAIMIRGQDTFVLDSKYYKYGLTKSPAHLPGAESVCKQMAYAEYVETRLKEIPAFAGMTSHGVYNAFIMPYCADAGKWDEIAAVAELPRNDVYAMKRVGYIYGDWKNEEDENRPYHKIYCILLDMKSVMRNYANTPTAQSELAGLIR